MDPYNVIDKERFQHVIGHFMSGVTVITTRSEDVDYGLTASAVACLSLEPPMLLVCIHRKSGTCHAISKSRFFGVNILYDHQGELAIRFAKPNTDKFEGINVVRGELGGPLLQHALATVECRVVEEVIGGTHTVFIAEAVRASAAEGNPLAYFRGKFGRFQGAADEGVYRQVRGMVVRRDLPAKADLDLQGLAALLECPSQAVYYAVTRLESEGLVLRESDGSFRIRPLGAKLLTEALDTRCALEIAALEQVAGKLEQSGVDELRRRTEDSVRDYCGSLEAVDRYIESNTAYHDYIVASAGNATLLEAYRRLTAEAVITSALRGAIEAKDETACRELDALSHDHVRLTEAIIVGDLEASKAIVRRHTEEAKKLGRYLIDNAGGSI
ncbi:flavin reductase [Paenibacillus hamazuiensis]|uniref:flavin reductase n=1 Tax=Paenibacillus hamazuiensis TaxID=2936508 RepID=UPI00200FC490|nr:flavin reductase [Paenibacillus hamazuiensis]